MTAPSRSQQVKEAAEFLLGRTACRPAIGVILGSGLAAVVDELVSPEMIAFHEIPHLAKPTVPGHPGHLALGVLAGKDVAILAGRLHLYEGYSAWQVTFPVRLMRALGAAVLIVTNAAGGINPHLHPGDLMLISDHVCLPCLAGQSPLSGLEREFGPRFVDMSRAYDPELHKLAWAVAGHLRLPAHSGVYAMVGGPSYETPAELRYLKTIGADAVGMSTAPEVIVAAQVGMRVLGISGITNQVLAGHAGASHEDVLAQGRELAPRLGALVKEVVQALVVEVRS